MHCEGCEKDVGDIKALKAHRKGCETYQAWNRRYTTAGQALPVEHKYEGRVLPRIFA